MGGKENLHVFARVRAPPPLPLRAKALVDVAVSIVGQVTNTITGRVEWYRVLYESGKLHYHSRLHCSVCMADLVVAYDAARLRFAGTYPRNSTLVVPPLPSVKFAPR